MWDGFNKRKFPRVNLRCEIKIQSDSETAPLVALTENVGVGGVCVIVDRAIERFSACRVKLELDEKLPPIECVGKVVWVVPTHDGKSKKQKYDIGVEFLNLEMAAFESIRHFVLSEAQRNPASITR